MTRAFTWLASTAGTLAIAAAMTFGATVASAQEATPTTPSAKPAPGAGKAMRMHRDQTPGWAMMTREERNQHHQMMMGMKDQATCQAYMQEHHAKMAERAKERGRAAPAMPRQDACASLKK